jgi:predicted O-methyltransferase YrrM
MQVSQHWSFLRRSVRDLLARGVERRGYELVPANHAGASEEEAHVALESIPIGRTEPFSTAHYDILPRGMFDVVPHDYYSPIPDLSRLPEDVWRRRSDLCGVDLDPNAGIEFLERELAPFVDEMDFQTEDPGEPGVFFLRNATFESVDAELLYGLIRSLRPNRVIELGSGYTTLLLNMAIKRNAEAGAPTKHVAYDPYPREHILGKSVPEPTKLEAISATDVPLTVFTQLEAGDVLFVDTTHTVKLASDVNYILLDVLPRLNPGVLVHFHDIFLPWEYPRAWFEEMRYFWAEQYLLQAFLAFNNAFEVLVPAHAIARQHPDRLARLIPSFRAGVSPGSFWLRRCAQEPSNVTQPGLNGG